MKFDVERSMIRTATEPAFIDEVEVQTRVNGFSSALTLRASDDEEKNL